MNYKIALIGMMGSGKTSTSKELSKALNCPLFDCDKIFEETYNIKITDYFRQYGEEKFRICENIILNKIIKNDNFIISTGGGIILNKENRDILFKKDIVTFYLNSNSKTIYSRIKNEKNRPLLLVLDPETQIQKLIKEREKYYKLANYEIDNNNKTIKSTVEEIIEKYEKNRNNK